MDEEVSDCSKHPDVESWHYLARTRRYCLLGNIQERKTKTLSRHVVSLKSNWCVRVLLHENDTHAFLFAALKKVPIGPLSLYLQLLSELSSSNIPNDRNIYLWGTTLRFQCIWIKTPSYRNDKPFRTGSVLIFDTASSNQLTNLEASW